MRKLAERAQESTAQIQGLVTEIQAYTQTTVLASEAGTREAGRGVEVAGAASTALDRIAQMVDSTTTAVAEISVATQQQRSASDQVVQAMSQVADMAQAFAAGSQQTSGLGGGDHRAGRRVLRGDRPVRGRPERRLRAPGQRVSLAARAERLRELVPKSE